MALKETIGAWLRSVIARLEGSATVTTSDEAAKTASSVASTSTKFQLENHRRAVVGDARKMYSEDDRVEAILNTMARDATHGGFTIEVMGGPDEGAITRAQELADTLIEALDLTDRMDDWARLSFRDGDTFLEVGVTADRFIEKVTRKPTLLMRRNSNSVDEFDDPTQAYWYSDKTWAALPPMDATWFSDWQIIHARWMHDEGQRYGQPQFRSARTAYKRMREGEFDMAIRRKTRAGLKLLHVVKGANDAEIMEYRERNKDALNDPFAAVADFFSSTEGSISAIQGDNQLGQINDVTHHIETFWVGSPVPMVLLGYGKNLNRDVLQEQKEQYDEILPTITRWVETNLLKPLVELQWLLQGIWPKEIKWRVVWNVKQVLKADDVQKVGQGVVVLQSTDLIDDETLLDIIGTFLPTIDLSRAREELEKRIENEEAHMDTAAMLARAALQSDDDEEEDDEGDEAQESAGWMSRLLSETARPDPPPAPSPHLFVG